MALSTEKGKYDLLAVFFIIILLFFIIVIIIDYAEIEKVHQKRQQQSTKINQENTQTNTRMNSTQTYSRKSNTDTRQADFALIKARERAAHEKILDELDRRERESNIKRELDRRRELAEIKQAIKPKLHLLNWHWHNEHSYAIAQGEIQNISSNNLRNVMAVVTWYTANKKFITSDDSFIDYNPIIPGQISPFSVMATYNPAMQTATITFKEMMGGLIFCKYEDKYHQYKNKKDSNEKKF